MPERHPRNTAVARRGEAPVNLGEAFETVVLFVSLALAVNLAVYGWLGASGAYSVKAASRSEKLVYLFIAGAFTVMAAATWYALAFVVRPFE